MSKNKELDDHLFVFALFGLAFVAAFGGWFVVRTTVRHPFAMAAVAATGLMYAMSGPRAVAACWVVIAGLLLLWHWTAAGSFDRSVSWRARGSWRGWWVYGRRWRTAITMCDLGDRYEGDRFVPRLVRVRSNTWMDRVSVRLLKGQKPADVQAEAETLAHTFGQLACRVRVAGPGRVELDFTRRDALAAIIPALPVPGEVDLRALPVGMREDGNIWTIRLLGRHWLIAGETGAGKGSVLQSIIRASCPVIRSGLVRMHGIDPKGGMELAAAGGGALYHQLVTDDPYDQAELLEELVSRMKARARRLAGITRLHTPTVDDPLELLVIDELAALTAYKPRSREARDLFARIDMNTNLLVSQGRAVGFVVIAALQDPRKEVIPDRDIWPGRIALRLPEAEATTMVLGPTARDRGADCSLIDPLTPGVAWVWSEGAPDPVRVRASNVTDADIGHQVSQYRPLPDDVIDAQVVDLHPTDSEEVPA